MTRSMGRGKGLIRRAVGPALALLENRQRTLDRTSPATKLALRALLLQYGRDASTGTLPSVWDTGLRVFSQFDEDGVILFLLGATGTGTRRFVDIGAANCVDASNCANLALNLGFHGLFIEAKAEAVEYGRRFYATHPDTREQPPVIEQAFVTRENVNELVRGAGFEGEIDLLSIDIDGNDYWIWEALECVSPRFVVIETHTELGLEEWVMPYEQGFTWQRLAEGSPLGASPVAMIKLANRLGYRLVGANLYGFNTLFARDDVGAALLPTIGVDELFRHGAA